MKPIQTIFMLLLLVGTSSAQVFDEANILNQTLEDTLSHKLRLLNKNIEIHTTPINPRDNYFTIIYNNYVMLHDKTPTSLKESEINPLYKTHLDNPEKSLGIILSAYMKKAASLETTKIQCKPPQKLIGPRCCQDKNNNSICDYVELSACNHPFMKIGSDCCLDANSDNTCDTITTTSSTTLPSRAPPTTITPTQQIINTNPVIFVIIALVFIICAVCFLWLIGDNE